MGKLPYPVQYFFCKTEDITQEIMVKMVEFSNKMDIIAGEILGETGIEGLKLDFNNGLRVQVPPGNWHVIVRDHDSGIVFFDQDVSAVVLISMEKYYIHWQIEIFSDGEMVFGHIFDPTGQKIRLDFVSNLIGDMLSFLPYIPMVRDFWQADVYYLIAESMSEICERLFPDIRQKNDVEEGTYATFYFSPSLGTWGWVPFDGRTVPLTRMGQMILGFPYPPSKLDWVPGLRAIKEPYVCIGVQASIVGKGWLYPAGWEAVTEHIKSLGYRVLCIDRDKKLQGAGFTLEMPEGAEDFTGDRPLLERADMLYHAEFFVGLSSGLSWLAYTAGCPVVMIGGFTMYWNEFPTPYRVYNRLICNGCYNDLRIDWQKSPCDRQWAGSEEVLQCSKKITPRMVIQAIDRLISDKKAGRLGQSSFCA